MLSGTTEAVGQAAMPRTLRRLAGDTGSNRLAIALVVLALATGAVMAGLASGGLTAAAAVAAHIAVVTAVAVWLRVRGPVDVPLAVVSLLTVLLAGPFGALFGLAALGAIRLGLPPADLDRWYARVNERPGTDAATNIAGELESGRALRLTAKPPVNFHAVMATGSLAQKQALLGLIGLRYHHDYFDLIQQALRSDEASIRVQAAAAYVKISQNYKASLRAALNEATGGVETVDAALALVVRLEDAAGSGFIGPTDVRKARAAVVRLCQDVLERDPMCALAAEVLRRVTAAMDERPSLPAPDVVMARKAPVQLRSEVVAFDGERLSHRRPLDDGAPPPSAATSQGA